jgi:ubiquinone/menaquinone biosynthesis C-methylase UbiE
VGAGNLEHFKNTKLRFCEYTASDIQDIRDDQYVKNYNATNNSRLKIIRADAQNLKFPENEFDLLIATCLLIHLPFPEQSLQEWRRVVKHRGELVIYVPCDPGFLIRVARILFVLPKHLFYKSKDYQLICVREHISSLFVLNKLIREVFKNDQIRLRRWPFRLLSWNFNLAYIYQVSVTKK